jgi:opacity protein-like surface antigen
MRRLVASGLVISMSGSYSFAQMSVVSARLVSVIAFAVLCLDASAAHAQAVPYWTSGWPSAFGGSPSADPSSNPYSAFSGFDGSASGSFTSRYNFSNGWFVGSERGGLGLGMNGFSQAGAFSNTSSFSYEGVQFGYNFNSAPVTVYAGFDTLKYNTGVGGPFANFDSSSSTLPGYSAHAGVEFRPTSNLSLSLGVGYAQQPGGIDSLSLPGASPFAFGGRR